MKRPSRRQVLAALAVGTVGGGVYVATRGRDCPPIRPNEWTFHPYSLPYNAVCGPIYDDDLVFAAEGTGVVSGSDSDEFRAWAFDAGSGEVVWSRTQRKYGWAPPAVRDGVAYFPNGTNEVVAFDAETGDVEWRYGTDNDWIGIMVPPVVVDGLVVVAPSNLTAERFEGSDAVVGLDAETGSELWHLPLEGRVRRPPTVSGSTLVAATAAGHLYGVDPVTGERRWHRKVVQGEDNDLGAVGKDGEVYVVEADRRVVARDANEGIELWSSHVPGGGPAVGTENAESSSPRTLTTVGDILLVDNGDGRVFGYDRAGDDERWQYRAIADVVDVAAAGDGIAVLDHASAVHRLDPANGNPAERFRTRNYECNVERRGRFLNGIEATTESVYTTGGDLVKTPLPGP